MGSLKVKGLFLISINLRARQYFNQPQKSHGLHQHHVIIHLHCLTTLFILLCISDTQPPKTCSPERNVEQPEQLNGWLVGPTDQTSRSDPPIMVAQGLSTRSMAQINHQVVSPGPTTKSNKRKHLIIKSRL